MTPARVEYLRLSIELMTDKELRETLRLAETLREEIVALMRLRGHAKRRVRLD